MFTLTAILKKCNSMQDIRKAAEKARVCAEREIEEGVDGGNIDVKEAWLECVEPVIALLRTRFERLVLKGKQVCNKNKNNKNHFQHSMQCLLFNILLALFVTGCYKESSVF